MFVPGDAVRVAALCDPDASGWLIQETEKRAPGC
jgi:hypothetical protein